MDEPVRLAARDGVLEVVLDRPKANAIDAATSRRMGAVFTASATTRDWESPSSPAPASGSSRPAGT